jgi:hypothetical protein
MSRRLICESCHQHFHCCAESLTACWCAAISVSESARQEIREKYADCICQNCLLRYASTTSHDRTSDALPRDKNADAAQRNPTKA